MKNDLMRISSGVAVVNHAVFISHTSVGHACFTFEAECKLGTGVSDPVTSLRLTTTAAVTQTVSCRSFKSSDQRLGLDPASARYFPCIGALTEVQVADS